MRKRKASLHPSAERLVLPVLPARSRVLVRPNCRAVPGPSLPLEPQSQDLRTGSSSTGSLAPSTLDLAHRRLLQ
jgi:hypothetical protein